MMCIELAGPDAGDSINLAAYVLKFPTIGCCSDEKNKTYQDENERKASRELVEQEQKLTGCWKQLEGLFQPPRW
jgi:hypothetical protein